MKKVQHIILAAIAAVSVSTSAMAGEHTIVGGLSKTSIDSAPKDLYGVNVKYRYEGGSRLGLIATGTINANSTDELVAQNGKLTTKKETTYGYGSFSLGPVYRLNSVLSAYSTVGYADYFVEVNDKAKNTKYKTRDEEMFSASLGMQANITTHLVLDASYEYVPFSGDNDAGTFSLGLGYRF
ncbi:Ail/Lom family outer membrane beta-barrel protein [uncultured Photobacterium sp.]|uniref:Ail/Lom family outer membrane beta-barrel protein n=1 Tax=uncultured Photobacterium sp. TaxID=173973 RepID=UPI0026132BAB|nr:Ail/Lom family outer membrane beta-barrel protein [uncultured Photobacterium sp.]